jgi:hypothetical protein
MSANLGMTMTNVLWTNRSSDLSDVGFGSFVEIGQGRNFFLELVERFGQHAEAVDVVTYGVVQRRIRVGRKLQPRS